MIHETHSVDKEKPQMGTKLTSFDDTTNSCLDRVAEQVLKIMLVDNGLFKTINIIWTKTNSEFKMFPHPHIGVYKRNYGVQFDDAESYDNLLMSRICISLRSTENLMLADWNKCQICLLNWNVSVITEPNIALTFCLVSGTTAVTMVFSSSPFLVP